MPGSKFHFPTALGLFILLVAVGVGLFLVKTKTGVKIGTDESFIPKQVRITNVNETGFTVSWLTNGSINGLVKYGSESNSIKQSALDDRDQMTGESGKFEVHYVTVKNLSPSTNYFFKLESGKKQFDNNGKPFEIVTGAVLGTPPAADPVYGTILSSSGSGAEGVIVYLNMPNAAPMSALAKTNGNWALSLSMARTSDLGSYLVYDTQATMINILVQGGSVGNSPVITTTSNDSPVPDITLGKSHDFRDVVDESINNLDASTDVDSEPSNSGFDLAPVASGSAMITESGEITLDNPSFEGEIINATQPAFIGTGLPGTVLSITVNSQNAYTGSTTIDEDGSWEFIPSEGLEPGEHEVTVNYIDSEGDEKTLTRSFLIAAAGESEVPAITATESGSVGSTLSGRTELPSTESGVPDPGTWEVTLMMLLTGVGLVFGGVIIKNRI
ncbi:MAG: Ig-like domain-containing protein [Patescibacteria group bacterium]|nr:Ig-like domain-containing protein [Patescibacteria group bacterium]